MEKLKMHSPNVTNANIEQIKKIFPNCITESQDESGKLKLAVDFDKLRQELSDSIAEGPQERYHLNWPGKREALLTANAPIAKTLRPSVDESVDFESTKNLFIEGDNLEALKLLQETYLGKVKMIYIDPPYNTGKDFVYKDNFTENTEEFLKKSNQKDEEGNRLVANNESNGRFHSDWLTMIYPRLKLARNLLRDDGVIFISIDDNEQANLKKICDEVFGEDNFVGCIARICKKTSDAGNFFAPSKDYVLVFSKSISDTNCFKQSLSAEDISQFKEKDEVGNYKSVGLYQASLSLERSRNARYFIECPDGSKCIPPENKRWRVVEETYLKLKNENKIIFKDVTSSPLLDESNKKSKYNIYTKMYLKDRQADGKVPRDFVDIPNALGTKNIKQLNMNFDFSKPIELVNWFIEIIKIKPEDIILDFFAGSSTTAHAVMKLNAEDGGNRKFIMAQLPEACDEKSEAFKAGYKNIAEISKERIRRAGKKILEGQTNEGWNKDVGFRVLKVDSSNMADIYYSPDATKQADLLSSIDNIKPDRSSEDLLFQVLLDLGVDLSLPITKQNIQGKTVFFVNQEPFDLVACFDGGITEELVKEIAKTKPLRAVFRDNGFVSDSVKINAEQIFKQISPSTDIKAI
jgi:adenine-specific DNA-methyltransferase